MWGFLFKFLSGRMLAGVAAVTLTGLLAAGFMWLRSVERKAAEQAVLVQVLEDNLAKARQQVERERAERERAYRLLRRVENTLASVRADYVKAVSGLKEVPDEGCLDRTVPAAVDRLLRSQGGD